MLLTIFTPTYNRAHTLERLYHSLCRQTISDFEWLVIDDGSTDGTSTLFENWIIQDKKFTIHYERVQNGGKHRAINRGVRFALGRLFFIVDSDDFLTDDAVEKIAAWDQEILSIQGKFAGFSGCKGYTKEQLIGTGSGEIPYVDCISQQRKLYGITGDKAEVFYTEVLKNFPFPEIQGENFISESVVWYAIGKAGYQIRWYNEIIYICEYLQDGLSAKGMSIFERNPRGYLIFLKSEIENTKMNFAKRVAYYAKYYEIGSKLQISASILARDLSVPQLWMKFTYFIAKIIKRNK